jgi:hypothetical protein
MFVPSENETKLKINIVSDTPIEKPIFHLKGTTVSE